MQSVNLRICTFWQLYMHLINKGANFFWDILRLYINTQSSKFRKFFWYKKKREIKTDWKRIKKFIHFQSVLISLYFLYVKEILNLLDCVLRYSLRISQKKFAPLLIKCTYNCQNVHIWRMTDCITILTQYHWSFIDT